MSKLVCISAILALFVQSFAGLLPLRSVPHTHILIGNVTPAQLRAHEEAEAQAAAVLSNSPAPAAAATARAVTPTGGLIISVAPVSPALASVLHFDSALQPAFWFRSPLSRSACLIPRVAWQTRVLASFDPPPRAGRAPA